MVLETMVLFLTLLAAPFVCIVMTVAFLLFIYNFDPKKIGEVANDPASPGYEPPFSLSLFLLSLFLSLSRAINILRSRTKMSAHSV
jgi:hypothetical protein